MDAVRGLEQRVAEDAASQLDADRIPEFGGGPMDLARRTDLLSEVLALALQTDSTRVATFMLANEGSNRPYAEVGVTQVHHDVSHHGNDPAKIERMSKINAFHVSLFAEYLAKLAAVNTELPQAADAPGRRPGRDFNDQWPGASEIGEAEDVRGGGIGREQAKFVAVAVVDD
jgi:hypothetical protein